jgi:hypothetical protein
VARTQDQLLDVVRARTGRHDPTDPWAAAIVSARALLPHRREEHLGALSDGLAPLVQAAIAWAARDETREPRIRMRALQENLLCSVCAWVSNEHMTKPGRIFA